MEVNFAPRSSADRSFAREAQHRFIHAGRPQSNGCVEQVQRPVLEECW
jgi:transposase InsO family protein